MIQLTDTPAALLVCERCGQTAMGLLQVGTFRFMRAGPRTQGKDPLGHRYDEATDLLAGRSTIPQTARRQLDHAATDVRSALATTGRGSGAVGN